MTHVSAGSDWVRPCMDCGKGNQICSIDMRGDGITYMWECTTCGAMERRTRRRGQDRRADEPPTAIDLGGE